MEFAMPNLAANSEQQEEQVISQPCRRRTLCEPRIGHLWPIVLLFVVLGGIGFVLFSRVGLDKGDSLIVQRQERSLDRDWYKKYALSKRSIEDSSQQQSTWNDVYDTNNIESKQRYRRDVSAQQEFEPPEMMGYITIYISAISRSDMKKCTKHFRFPVACYNQSQFPLTGPFLNFIPWLPIVADLLTEQTVIYSSIGVHLLPSLADAYGKRYSIAELIALNYASLGSANTQPTDFIDIQSLFLPSTILQPDMPTISPTTGGFVDCVHTDFDFVDGHKKEAELLISSRDSKGQEQYEIHYQLPPYLQIKHDRQRKNRTKSAGTQISSPDITVVTPTPITSFNGTSQSSEVHYTFIVDEVFPYPQSRKPVISVNYSFPGPVLEAYEGDTFVIKLINRLNVATTIHWHGMKQQGTPEMDGTVGLSQCAIPPGYELTYRFNATPAGTTLYHGHFREQYVDGLYGPLIVRRRQEPNQELYDAEQILMVADWYNQPAHSKLLPWYLNPNNPDGNEPSPDAIVVSGKFTQSLFISLSGLRRIRFRVINSAAFAMFNISIDGLPLHVIEVDNDATFPYTVNSFCINVAQRVSFYINLDELDPSYASGGASETNAVFFRVQAVLSMYPVDIVNYIPPYERQRYPYPTFFNPVYVAILSFDSTNSTPTYPISQATPTLAGAVTPQGTNLLAARPFDGNSGGIPNATHYLELVIAFQTGSDGINRAYMNNVTYSSDANGMHVRPDPKVGITSDLYAPILQQMGEKPNGLNIPSPRIQAGSSLPTIQSDKNGHYLIPYLAVVDVFLNNTDGGEHPFHLHSYDFWVIATSDFPEAEFLYAGDYIQRDTVSVPALGWAKIRFLADNPGAWFFHCHIEWHLSAGLALAYVVAPDQLVADGYEVTQRQKDVCQALEQFHARIEAKAQRHPKQSAVDPIL